MKRHLLLLIALWGYNLTGISQEHINKLFTTFGERWENHTSELIYLQTSKSIYETGEDLWFKAWQLNAQSFGLSDQSKTLYLQMISEKDSIVWQEKYPVENGIAEGHVYINERLPEGAYFLQAYTRHSFHNDTTGVLQTRKINVVHNIAGCTPRKEEETEKETGNRIRFKLFPEGGNLVSGLPSRLAFKATDGKGFSVEVEGTLFQEDKRITTFKSNHDGMGSLFFTPETNKEYHIETEEGQTYSLPKIHPLGMTLHLSGQDEKNLEFIISQTKGLPEQEIYLLGQIRGVICCIANGVLKERLKITIPLVELPWQGIAEFTLLNSSMQPLAERLVYVHPKKKLHINIEPDKNNYTIREKATLKIKVTDEEGNPVRTNLGISVFDKAYDNPNEQTNILTHCYLSSQIRGRIHNPAYYFDEKNTDRMQAMELLLLTQGWRRYVWNSNDTRQYGEMFLSDELSGVQTIGSKKRDKEMQGTEQLIQVSGAEGNSAFVWRDSTGRFTIDTNMMKELRGGYIYLKPMLSKEYKSKLDIEDDFSQINNVRRGSPIYCLPTEWIQSGKKQHPDIPVISSDSTILLDEVVVTRKASRPFRDKFMGRLDSLAQADLNGPWVCPEGHLENYKEGYTAHHDPRYCPNPTFVPLEERSKPVEGKAYYIIKPKYFDSGRFIVEAAETVVYRGPLYTEEELLRMNNLWRAKGYYAAREFYQPDEIDMKLSTPDARNTLLWQPSVITDERGEATVSFYCSDINTGFTGHVEGVDGTGLLGSEKCEFRVLRGIN